MLSEGERENVTKAAQCAALLVSDVKALAASDNPLLAELGIEALKAAIADTGYTVTGAEEKPYEKKGFFSFLKH